MILRFSKLIDRVSEFIAARKGLLPMTGIAFVLINFLIGQASDSWLAESNIFMHLGIIIAIIGLMVARAL